MIIVQQFALTYCQLSHSVSFSRFDLRRRGLSGGEGISRKERRLPLGPTAAGEKTCLKWLASERIIIYRYWLFGGY